MVPQLYHMMPRSSGICLRLLFVRTDSVCYVMIVDSYKYNYTNGEFSGQYASAVGESDADADG